MAIQVGFLTTLGVNVGDEFIREGIRHVLDRCGVPYAPFYVNKHDRGTLARPVEDEVTETGNKFWASDLFIQAGAPVYWHLGRHTSVTSEWHGWFWESLAFCPTPPGPAPVFVNLGAGTTQAWGEGVESFLQDEACARFARQAAQRSLLTTVRDPLASHLLGRLGIEHQVLPCPAFLAGGRHAKGGPIRGLIGVNLMPLASHYDLTGDFDRARWRKTAQLLVRDLRRDSSLVFICHNRDEVEFCGAFREPGERIFWSATWRDYLDAYAQCEAVVANRVHGAVCAAGFGVPSIIIGNDTRAQIGDLLGIRRFHAATMDPAEAASAMRALRQQWTAESVRLLAAREESACKYQKLLQGIVERAAVGAREIPA